MRCPYCASPRAVLPHCWACGMPLENVDPAHLHPQLEELEPTRFAFAEVSAERLQDLQTRQEWHVGDVLTDSHLAANMPCQNCGSAIGLATTCPACGAVRHAHDDTDDADVDAATSASCRHCGTPSPGGRERCLNCGTRMDVDREQNTA